MALGNYYINIDVDTEVDEELTKDLHTMYLVATTRSASPIDTEHDVQGFVLPWFLVEMRKVRARKTWPICDLRYCKQPLEVRVDCAEGMRPSLYLRLACPLSTYMMTNSFNPIEKILQKLGYLR